MCNAVELPPPPHLSHYLWRAVQKSDMPAIQEMMARTATGGIGESVASAESIAAIFDMLGTEIGINTRIAITTDGTIAALALILFRSDEEAKVAMIDGLVDVGHRGQGLGGYILDWMEARVREEFAEIHDGAPQSIRMSCAEHQTDRIALFQDREFKAARYSYKMQRPLDQPIRPVPLPQGLKLIQWTEALDVPLMHAFNEAFHEHWGLPRMNEALWHQFFTGVPQFRGDLTYLVVDEETIVGFCLNWINEHQSVQGTIREGWIEAIGVIPSQRGRGIASALITNTLNALIAQGLEQVALDVDTQNPSGALDLYEKLGFQAAKRTIIFTKNL